MEYYSRFLYSLTWILLSSRTALEGKPIQLHCGLAIPNSHTRLLTKANPGSPSVQSFPMQISRSFVCRASFSVGLGGSLLLSTYFITRIPPVLSQYVKELLFLSFVVREGFEPAEPRREQIYSLSALTACVSHLVGA